MWSVPGSAYFGATMPPILSYVLRWEGNGANRTRTYAVSWAGQDSVNGFNYTVTVGSLRPNTPYAFFLTPSNVPTVRVYWQLGERPP